MSDEAKPRSWWSTLPGILTGMAALLTALAGLLAALAQTGWFGDRNSPTASPAATSAEYATPTVEAAAPTDAVKPRPAPADAPRAHAVALPAQRDYSLGPAASKSTFTLLKAEVVPRTTEKSMLHIRLRMTNHDRYDKNFWDSSFRLLVDGVPIAPESGLNEVVAAESAKEGDVLFPLARGTRNATLRIKFYDDATEIPLVLAP